MWLAAKGGRLFRQGVLGAASPVGRAAAVARYFLCSHLQGGVWGKMP